MATGFTGTLPALSLGDSQQNIKETINQLLKQRNRQDAFVPIYAADTGSGSAYVITPTPGIKFYRVGQIFTFKATNANTTTAPTLNVNGWGAGTITYPDGTALVLGDIAANGFYTVQVTSTTPTFELMTLPGRARGFVSATTFMGSDVNLNNVANFFDLANTGSIGANGQVWAVSGQGLFTDTAAAAVELAIFNSVSSAYISDQVDRVEVSTGQIHIALQPVIVSLTAATTFTLRGKDLSNTSGVAKTTGLTSGTANKATSITAVRLA